MVPPAATGSRMIVMAGRIHNMRLTISSKCRKDRRSISSVHRIIIAIVEWAVAATTSRPIEDIMDQTVVRTL